MNLPIFKLNRSILVGDSFHTFHPVGGQGLNTCWRDVNKIFDMFNNDLSFGDLNFKLIKFKYYFTRFFDIFTIIFITDFLIRFFANRNLILVPFKKLSFLLLNNFLIIRKIVLNQMTKSIIFLTIK